MIGTVYVTKCRTLKSRISSQNSSELNINEILDSKLFWVILELVGLSIRVNGERTFTESTSEGSNFEMDTVYVVSKIGGAASNRFTTIMATHLRSNTFGLDIFYPYMGSTLGLDTYI